MSIQQQLLERIQKRTALIGVVGLGYVGLPLAVEFAEVGFQVIGLDVSPEKVRQLIQTCLSSSKRLAPSPLSATKAY
jgi:UDP-N-acetyl-D-glucosamine dehydrogenase